MNRIAPTAVASLAFLLLLGCAKPANDSGFDWPQWRGPDGNGQSRETEWDPAAIANPKILWTVNVGLGYSNVAIQDGWLYTVGTTKNGFTVSCLNAVTGKLRWKQTLPSTYNPQATPAVDGNDLFVLTNDGTLQALNARSGKRKWAKDLVAEYGAVKPSYDFAGSPIVAGDLVILNANTAGMAVKQTTGGLAWTSPKPPKEFPALDHTTTTGTTYSTPVLYGEGGSRRAIFVSWRGITSADVATGLPSWTYDFTVDPGGATPDPVVVGDTVCVLFASDPQALFAGFLLEIDGDVPRLAWRTPDLVTLGPGSIAVDGFLYCTYYGFWGDSQRPPTSLRCLDLATGRLMWEERFGKDYTNKYFSLASANNVLIILDDKGILRAARSSPDAYQEIAQGDVLQGANRPRQFWTPPVLCNAKIYCRNFGGDLVCIDVSK